MRDARGRTDIFLISGIPGAGKTTVARALAERFDRGVHLEGDVVGYHFIASGLVLPHDEPADEAGRQMDLRRKNMCLLARSFAEAGFTTVVDDVVVSASVLDVYRSLAPLRFVQLSPRLEVAASRDAGREKHFFEVWKHLDDVRLAWPEPRPGLWLDSSDLTVAQTVDAILERADEAVV